MSEHRASHQSQSARSHRQRQPNCNRSRHRLAVVLYQFTVCSAYPSQSWHTTCVTIRRVSSDSRCEADVLCACRSGWCSAVDQARLVSVLRRCKRQHFSPIDLPSVTDLFSEVDEILTNSHHILQTFLPERSNVLYHFRNRSRNNHLSK